MVARAAEMLAMDERLLLVKFLIGLSTDCGESIEDARAQAKQEIARLVTSNDITALSRLKARAKLNSSESAAAMNAIGSSSNRIARVEDSRQALTANDNKRFEFNPLSIPFS